MKEPGLRRWLNSRARKGSHHLDSMKKKASINTGRVLPLTWYPDLAELQDKSQEKWKDKMLAKWQESSNLDFLSLLTRTEMSDKVLQAVFS